MQSGLVAKTLEQRGQGLANVMAVGRRSAPQIAHHPAAGALDHLLANLKRSFAAEFAERIGLGNQPSQLVVGS